MCGKFRFNGGFEQTFVGIDSSLAHLLATFIVTTYELAFQTFDARLVVRSDGHFQQPFGFGTAELDEYLCKYEKAGFPPVSHSEAYRQAYKPSYRIIRI